MIHTQKSHLPVQPFTSGKKAASFTCLFDTVEQRPEAVLCCDSEAAALTGFSCRHLTTCKFTDLCRDFPPLNPADFGKNVNFRNELYTYSGLPLLCDFYCTAMYNTDAVLLQIVVLPVSFEISQPPRQKLSTPSNKLEILEILSHGVSHSINNSINLLTLSSDLLSELIDNIMSHFDPSIDITIKGMSLPDLSRMVHQLIDNFLNSSSRINAVSQALVQCLRINEPNPGSGYDFRKIINTAVTLTEHEINNSSYEFIYDPPSGIIKRTGNQFEILQAVLNCILFLCRCVSGKIGRFSIRSINRPDQNSFSIELHHDKAVLPLNDIGLTDLLKTSDTDTTSNHPLSVAKSLIVANCGDLDVLQERAGGVLVRISLSTINIHF
jgi:hypothetical protein